MPKLSQEQIVFLLWVVMFATFAFALPGFLSYGNIITLIRGVAVLGSLPSAWRSSSSAAASICR